MLRGTIALFACTILGRIGVPSHDAQTCAHSGSIMPRLSRPSHGFARLSHGSAIDWIVGTLFVAALVPLGLIDIVPMTDYLNHLARMNLLAAAGTPDANPYYDITWNLYPTLAAAL